MASCPKALGRVSKKVRYNAIDTKLGVRGLGVANEADQGAGVANCHDYGTFARIIYIWTSMTLMTKISNSLKVYVKTFKIVEAI